MTADASSNLWPPVVILGTTAAGKSDFAVALAQALARTGEPLPQIINADSMQIYRRMDAGTAKPAPQLRQKVPHHLIDVVEPTERFTVADWLARAESLLQDRSHRWIIVGGTNLYVRALLQGLFEAPAMDPQLRAQLAQLDNATLHQRLARVDPAAADRIHPNDRKKIIRALEVFHLTGRPISSLQTQWRDFLTADPSRSTAPPPYRYNPILLGLTWPLELINRRINLRVKAMFFPEKARLQDHYELWPGTSLVDETRQLEQAGLLGPQARLALGYRQVLDYLAGRCSLEEAFERTKIETRRLAKRQRTWLRRYHHVHWLEPARHSLSELLTQALDILRQPAKT